MRQYDSTGLRPRVLVVEPDPALGRLVRRACLTIAQVTVCRDFLSARTRLFSSNPDLLAANFRLEEYNGLHLALLVAAEEMATRCVMYSDVLDRFLVHEAQEIGAFVERRDRLEAALPAYIHALLPPSPVLPEKDRRDAYVPDRRSSFRGGRRAADSVVTV
jgi:hypothetical protein